jgi:ABC-type branched-subunit amino acid transport system substrate-binding protein/predicted negative regulator of RcsB-dependent stress response
MYKNVFLFTFVLSFFLFQSCSQTPRITIPTQKTTPKEDIKSAAFHKAEQLYKTRSYAQALDMYKKYLKRASEDNNQFTDKALMKIGSIYTIQGKFTQAKDIYNRLIKEYPDSMFSSRAQLGLIYNDFSQKKYEEALRQIEPAFIVTNKKDHSQLFLLKGDILLALDRAQEAVVAYTYAFEIASENELSLIIKRTRQAITILAPDELQYLINVYQGRFPAVYMLYQQAQNEIKSENLPQAITILEKIVVDYPDHEMIAMIQEQIESIKKGKLFESYTIGCLLPLSGRYKQFGQEALNGALFAHSQFSTLQNVYPIQLKIQDSGETVEDAIQAFKKLLEENVKAIIGPITTNQAEAVAVSANAHQIPIILLVSRENITQDLEYVFRNFLTQELQIRAITSYAMDEIGYHDFAILYPDDRYGCSFMDAFWDGVIEKGGTVRAVNNYYANQTDFTESIKKMVGLHFDRPGVSKWRKKKLKPIVDFDAIFIPDRPDMILMIAPQLKSNGFNNVLLLGTNLWHDGKMIGVSKQKVLSLQDKVHHQGAVFPDLFFCNSQRPHVQQFVSAFEATFGNKPGLWEAITYDNAMILFESLNKGNIQYAQQLKDELLHMEGYTGLTGLIKFDPQGEAQRQLYLLKVKGDSFEEIGLR